MRPRNKADAYTYRVFWSPEDEEFVGVTAEFGDGLSWLAATADDAFVGIRRLVGHTLKELESEGEPVPEPLSLRTFSGKFMVRVPPELHRQLATEAAEAGVSLNRLIAHRLSTHSPGPPADRHASPTHRSGSTARSRPPSSE